MKFNFKKIASVIASTVMLSSTVALAAAANYPSPFVQSGVADVAVVYGANAAQTDMAAAVDITTNLNSKLAATITGPTTVSGGDFIKLEKTNNKFNLGESMDDFYGGSLDNSQLSTVLADGVYTNDANDDYDFEQEIVLGTTMQLNYFADNDYNDKEPTVGFNLVNDNHILNYTLEFTPDDMECSDFGLSPTVDDDCETTDLTMLGRTYYIVKTETVSGTGLKFTLLDAANSATVTEGESSTISVSGVPYEVKIVFVDSDETILDVNGVQTNKLAEGDVFKVGTDLYVGVKNVLYNEKESGISKVEISIGSGKIVMENKQEVEINGEDVSENTESVVKTYFTNTSTAVSQIVLDWDLDDDAFIAPGSDLILPGFETIKLSMGSFIEPSKEVTTVENSGEETLVLKTEVKDGDVELGILYQNSSSTGFGGIGTDSDEKLVTSRGATNAAPVTLNLTDDDTYFVASWTDGAEDAESYVFEVTGISGAATENTTTIKNVAKGATAAELDVGDDKDIGEINLKVLSANQATDVVTINITASGGSGTIYADKIYTADGLKIQLPVSSGTLTGDGILNFTAGNPTTWTINFTEESEDNVINTGKSFTFAITPTTDGPTVGSPSLSELDDTTDNDIKYAYVVSPLATKTTRDASGDPTTLDVEYHGDESYAEVFVSETGAAVIAEGSAGKVLAVKDSETVTAKNLVVVGGSCINSVAANLLGGALCGANFEAATGVGAGSFLIQSFARDGGGVATLVAGYNAEDTTNAAKYLTTQTVDTTAGKKYKGTTATSAELVVA